MQAGDLISGKYRLLRPLGSGGMGSVWAARNQLTDRDFAVKFLLPDLAANPEALHRFFLEARACGQIRHPAVVDVYDMGQAEDGSPYLVMELLEGEGFDQRLARSGRFRPSDAATWLAFVARGLHEAHQRGLIHRDLKPGNIFFAVDGRGDLVPRLLDFGVSKATGPNAGEFVKTSTGAVLGSPAYMSPEQAKGEGDIDGRSDVWSLGVILYEALTGQLPFDAPNYNALMIAIITRPHNEISKLAPDVPPELAKIVNHAMAKEREQRIGGALEFAEQLEIVAAKITGMPVPSFQPRSTGHGSGSIPGGGVPARPFGTTEGTWSDGRKTVARRRRSALLLTGGLLFATIVIGGGVAALQIRGPMVAVAGRSVVALNTGLARVRQQLEALNVEAQTQKAKTEAAPPASAPPIDIDKQAASAEPSTSADSPSKGRSRGRPAPRGGADKPGSNGPKPKTPGDPHGGVDNAGF